MKKINWGRVLVGCWLVCLIGYLLTGCCMSKELTENGYVTSSKEKCFKNGGSKFEYGTSGGGLHNVCIYENPNEGKSCPAPEH